MAAIGKEIEAKRIKTQLGERMTIGYYQDRWRIEAMVGSSASDP